MMQPQTNAPRFPLPSDDSPTTGWYFDRAFEALVFIERGDHHGQPQMNINAWSRRVWESAKFTSMGLRTMPSVPKVIHDALAREASRWR
jgi:hypothetical protein